MLLVKAHLLWRSGFELCPFQRLRSYKLCFDIPSEYHVRLIGPRGKVVNDLRTKHDVLIAFPRGDDPPDTITLTGIPLNMLNLIFLFLLPRNPSHLWCGGPV